ncbi:OLC1v1009408C2 [Oldenlandia corymbosa var. corymbosa]|nr:OLC1v1009408C2 [Oldenlandia corymbosa var. corymbosa]
MTYSTLDSTTSFSSGVTTVECHKQVRSWRLLRSLMELLIRGCGCLLVEGNDFRHKKHTHHYNVSQNPRNFYTYSTVTGTIFGSRRGKVSFCIQKNPKSTSPELLLELAIPTATLAREMKGGFLRIALKSKNSSSTTTFLNGNNSSGFCSLLSMPVWKMLCNGREAGFAVRRSPSEVDVEILQHMKSVVVGAGTLSAKQLQNQDEEDGDIMYLRGEFQRVFHKSSKSESFHLIDPDCNASQELSFFFLRS